MKESDNHGISRRALMQAAALVALGGCVKTNRDEISVTPEQRSEKPQRDSSVAILSVESYDHDISKPLGQSLTKLLLPSLKGKKVVIKPNMVEFHPQKPIHTNPAMIAAVAAAVDALGAATIVVAEGPGHMRDTQFLLEATGIGPQCAKLALPFIDLNFDELAKVPNHNGFTDLKHFELPRTILEADLVISLPKLKTHHWVGITASMKNLFGVVPGRKYGWPKNVLHVQGIGRSILDVVRLVPKRVAVVDAIVAMEGDGPVNGEAISTRFVAVGSDFAAVDATCARAMGIDPLSLPYLRAAGQVLGNTDPAHIQLIGTSLADITQTFQMPLTFLTPELLKEANTQGS